MSRMALMLIAVFLGVLMAAPGSVQAHCDTLTGPVIAEARKALAKGDVTPVLKWVKKEHEKEISAAFNKTLTVRKQSREAQELADMYFFETLVRIHREGEGAPYTGLKTEEPVDPGIQAADKALESGKVDGLVKGINHHIDEGIRDRFNRVMKSKKHADESVQAGREYVNAYVDFIHYFERIRTDAVGSPEHHH